MIKIDKVTLESNGFLEKKSDIIKRSKTRIFRPFEVKMLISEIPKLDYVDKFETLLYTGMRYIEVLRLYKHPEWFNGEIIHLSKEASKKKRVTISERYVHLNTLGKRAVMRYLKSSKPLPANYATWTENLRRWAIKAKLYPDLIGPKTTRKTWESWLITYYPNKFNQIFLSQGHSQLTSLQHYLNLPFNDRDKEEMKGFVEGWE